MEPIRKLHNYKPTPFKAEGYVYKERFADAAVAFVQQLKHFKGRWKGMPFELIDWSSRKLPHTVQLDRCTAPPHRTVRADFPHTALRHGLTGHVTYVARSSPDVIDFRIGNRVEFEKALILFDG
jgi:hypothetical protein